MMKFWNGKVKMNTSISLSLAVSFCLIFDVASIAPFNSPLLFSDVAAAQDVCEIDGMQLSMCECCRNESYCQNHGCSVCGYCPIHIRVGRLMISAEDKVEEFETFFNCPCGNVAFRAAASEIGTFSLVASIRAAFEGGFANIMARMFTIFKFGFERPQLIPEDIQLPSSIGFVSFVDGLRSVSLLNGWACPEGEVMASGRIIAQSVEAYSSVFANLTPFGECATSANPTEGFMRSGWIEVITLPQEANSTSKYKFEFYGEAYAEGRGEDVFALSSVEARAGIVVLSGVDPLGVPEVGDNEFVYNDNPPRLVIPVSATVISGFSDNEIMQWLTQRLWFYEWPQIPTLYTALLSKEYNGRRISPIWQDTIDQVCYSGLTFRLDWLPSLTHFGKHQIILAFNGQEVHAANIEIFFPAQGYGHMPDLPEGYNRCPIEHLLKKRIKPPNYIYYYARVYPSDDVIYIGEGRSHYHPPFGLYPGREIYIADEFAAFPYPVRLFWTSLRYTRGNPPVLKSLIAYIPDIDHLLVRGIHSYVYTVAHERGHMNDYFLGFTSQWGSDRDNDGLNDWFEERCPLFDPDKPDTAGAYPNDPIADAQASADIQAYADLLDAREIWQQDWAHWDGEIWFSGWFLLI